MTVLKLPCTPADPAEALSMRITAPKLSWAEYLENYRGGRSLPSAADIRDRWDTPRYSCPQIGRPGQQRVPHVKDQMSPGQCSCRDAANRPTELQRAGFMGWGEQRMYLAWLLNHMEPEEAAYFRMTILRAEMLVTLAITPVLKLLLEVSQRPIRAAAKKADDNDGQVG